MKILLLGKGGQVGWELQRSLAPLGEVVVLEFDSTDYCGDFTHLAEKDLMLREGSIVDATIIATRSSTKNRFGVKKVRDRGLAKNMAQLMTLFGLATLMIAERRLLELNAQGAS